MRIAVVNNFYPPRVGGSAHLSDALARGYAAAGHDVVVLTASYRDSPETEHRDGIRIIRIPAWTLPDIGLPISFDLEFTLRPSLARRVARVLDDFRPDVIHQHGQFFDLTWASGWWARRHRVPVLLSVHTRLESPSWLFQVAFRIIDAVLVRPVLWRYRPHFVVMDVQMDRYIRRRYRPARGTTVSIPVGVSLDGVSGGDAALVRSRHALGDQPIALSIGHVIEMRDRMTLVEALPQVRAAVPDAVVVVLGRIYLDRFLIRARELGVADMLVCPGAVPQSEIKHYLAAASVETHDLQGYGLGTASLESMGAGVPVVAAVAPDNFPGLRLRSGENCWLVPIGDRAALAAVLVDALADPGSHDKVAAGGRELVALNFTLDTVLAEHLAVLTDLVEPVEPAQPR